MKGILILLVSFLVVVVPVLLNIAFLTLVERKIMAAIQLRRGPNVIGFGFLQPFADGLKLLLKEFIIPLRANKRLFLVAPVLFLASILTIWSLMPYEWFVVCSPELGVLAVLTLSSISVYGLIGGGWGSNSRYALLGAIRAAAQLLSYELVLGIIVLFVCFEANSFNLVDIVEMQYEAWYIVSHLWLFPVFLIAILAETNRTPFDLPEAESELVAGYAVEYSAMPFALYFIGEYGSLIVWSHLTIIFFFGGWLVPTVISWMPPFILFELKTFFVYIFFCWVRSTLPRYRWDQLMYLTWRILLPGTLSLLFALVVCLGFNGVEEMPYDIIFSVSSEPLKVDFEAIYEIIIGLDGFAVSRSLNYFFSWWACALEAGYLIRLFRWNPSPDPTVSYWEEYQLVCERSRVRVMKAYLLLSLYAQFCVFTNDTGLGFLGTEEMYETLCIVFWVVLFLSFISLLLEDVIVSASLETAYPRRLQLFPASDEEDARELKTMMHTFFLELRRIWTMNFVRFRTSSFYPEFLEKKLFRLIDRAYNRLCRMGVLKARRQKIYHPELGWYLWDVTKPKISEQYEYIGTDPYALEKREASEKKQEPTKLVTRFQYKPAILGMIAYAWIVAFQAIIYLFWGFFSFRSDQALEFWNFHSFWAIDIIYVFSILLGLVVICIMVKLLFLKLKRNDIKKI